MGAQTQSVNTCTQSHTFIGTYAHIHPKTFILSRMHSHSQVNQVNLVLSVVQITNEYFEVNDPNTIRILEAFQWNPDWIEVILPVTITFKKITSHLIDSTHELIIVYFNLITDYLSYLDVSRGQLRELVILAVGRLLIWVSTLGFLPEEVASYRYTGNQL